MIIGLDYDGTYTADPDLWHSFCIRAKERGHTVIVVTWRSDTARWDNEHLHDLKHRGLVHDIVFADMEAKKVAAARAGYEVNIWIDDMPEAVNTGR